MTSVVSKCSLGSSFSLREGAACRELELPLVLQGEALPVRRVACPDQPCLAQAKSLALRAWKHTSIQIHAASPELPLS